MARYKNRSVKGHPLFPGKKAAAVHRVLVAERLGRPLARAEHVHHKNEDPADNSDGNLVLLAQTEHHRLHRLGVPRPEVAAKQRGRKHTPEAIERMKVAAAARREHLAALGREHGAKGGVKGKGKPKSPETRERMSEAAVRLRAHERFKRGTDAV